MKDLIDKLSSYNLFNYLLPGAIFVAAARRISAHTFTDQNIVIELFVYYFIGMCISRVGSLTVEPILKFVGFVKFASYKDFISACAKDAKIEVLSEQNNTYRTLCALFICVGGLKVYDALTQRMPRTTMVAAIAGLFILFVLAYRKQTAYIKERVEAVAK